MVALRDVKCSRTCGPPEGTAPNPLSVPDPSRSYDWFTPWQLNSFHLQIIATVSVGINNIMPRVLFSIIHAILSVMIGTSKSNA